MIRLIFESIVNRCGNIPVENLFWCFLRLGFWFILAGLRIWRFTGAFFIFIKHLIFQFLLNFRDLGRINLFESWRFLTLRILRMLKIHCYIKVVNQGKFNLMYVNFLFQWALKALLFQVRHKSLPQHLIISFLLIYFFVLVLLEL